MENEAPILESTTEGLRSLRHAKMKKDAQESVAEMPPPTSTHQHEAGITRHLGTPMKVEEIPSNGGINADSMPWEMVEQESGESDDAETIAILRELPETTQELLKTAACLGSLDTRLLEASTPHERNVSLHLSSAAEHGVIVFQDDAPDDSMFVSDDTLDSLYRLIRQDERSRQHVAIGRHLIQNLREEELEEHYYTVLRQLKLGSESISNQNERNAIANLCLRAGEFAVSKGDFASASRYLDFGISLLDHKSWKDEYDLTLALYNDSAEVEYSKSNFDRVDVLVSTVLENARCFRDTLRARASRIYSLSTRYCMSEAVDESLQVLDHLGEKFPAEPKRYHIGRELMRVWRLLKGKTNEMILRMPLMTDPDKISTVQILNLLFPGAYRTRPKLWGLIVLRVVRLTMLHGLSPVSAVGFAFYAAISSMVTGNIDDSYQYAELALALVDKFHAKEWIPRVYLGVYGHTSSYKFFLRDMYPKFQHAHHIGLKTGDIEVSEVALRCIFVTMQSLCAHHSFGYKWAQFSCLAANIYCMYHIFSGDSLIVLEEEAIGFSETFQSQHQGTALRMVLPCIQFVQNLMGKNDDPVKLVGDIINDESAIANMLAQAAASHDEISLAFINYYLLVLAYVFNDYEAAAEEANRLVRITQPPYLHPSMSSLYAFHALALLAICNNRCGRARRKILSTARHSIKKLKQFSLHTPENCLGNAFLLQAELAAVTGKNREARCHFTSAISVATRFGDLMMHAIACERAACFSSACGDEAAAGSYFREACSAYKDWGAIAKAEQLEKEMPAVFVVCESTNDRLTLSSRAAHN